MSPRRYSAPQETRAFSLVEVALALAVFAFAFVGLLGLIPVGLRSLDTAIDTTVEAQIVQHVSTLARQASFMSLKNDLLNINPGPDSQFQNREKPDYFFTEQGEEIRDVDRQQRDYVYAAAVVSHAGALVPAEGSADPAGYANQQVATVRVTITRRSSPEKLWVVTLFVVNNGLGP